ncbi:MAG: trypsin-like peptidase domain-containing protein [Myxococcaceae bacterium]|nr:trypsin-like peptidase domain-containing protein [Myxococcaceae bacterium]
MGIDLRQLSQALADVVARAGRSVVRVEGGRRRAGSGVVLSPQRVITAAHVLRGDQVSVGLEGEVRSAKVKGVDPTTDLALLEVDGAPLTPATFSDGAALTVGQLALQLGRPGETVRATSGIISVRGRQKVRLAQGGELDFWLEADAPHQPGFSGGALLDAGGEVVGLVTTALVRGTSVAIPTVTLQRVAAQLEAHGKPRQSWLGATLQPLTLPGDVQASTGEELGLLVAAVAPGGPAEQSGLRYGDTVLHLGDDTVKTLDDLYAYLRADHVGQTVPVTLYRQGRVEKVQVTLGARP